MQTVGQGSRKPASLRHPCPAMVTPDSRGSSCNHTGTRLRSHRDSSWRFRGQGMRAWPGGTGPVADSKKICNTHCSLEHKRHYWASWQSPPWDFERTPSESVKPNPEVFQMLQCFYHKNVPAPSTPMLTIQGHTWSKRTQSRIYCMDFPNGIYSQSSQLPLYYS